MKGGYFLFDGRFCKEGEAVFTLAELTSRGTGLTEFFRAEHNEILFPEAVCEHLMASANALGMDLSEWVDADGRLLRKDVSRLLNKNKLYLAAKICIQVFGAGGQIHTILSCEEMERGYFTLKDPGLLLSFYKEHRKWAKSDFSYPVFDNFMQHSAMRYAEEFNIPNMILLNSEGNACESIGGSFACISADTVIFPGPGSGGYRCSLKDVVVKCVKEAGFFPVERDTVECSELLNAEELFLFDAFNGIRKVLGLEDQRYFSIKTRTIAEILTRLARQDRKEKE